MVIVNSDTLFATSESLDAIQISPNSPFCGVRADFLDDFVYYQGIGNKGFSCSKNNAV